MVAVDNKADRVERVNELIAERGKRAGEAVAFKAFDFLFGPGLELAFGFIVSVQSAVFAIAVADLNFDFLLFGIRLTALTRNRMFSAFCCWRLWSEMMLRPVLKVWEGAGSRSKSTPQ